MQLLGKIIGYSLAGSRNALMQQYDKEAQHAYMTQAYDVALDRFCHFLALVETDHNTTMISEMRATLTANIGACLYGMDEPAIALTYLERALEEVRAPPPFCEGDVERYGDGGRVLTTIPPVRTRSSSSCLSPL